MGEPASTVGAVVAGAAGAGVAGFMTSVNGEAAVGALMGALIYFTTTRELPVVNRVIFFMVSFVMGYLFAPAIVGVEIMNTRPFQFPGPAAFAASCLVVAVSLAAIRRRGPAISAGGEKGNDG
ncbi:putative holin [Pseudomonas otitidis]|uniref:putative holin n=1 Tax=Pseudomonadaceae TaxID=135621 RepID=UPI0013F5F1AC|nr:MULTISPECIES: putative holin [Pseudomonas]MDH0334482.1 phage holin family protein [Pseudomonas otitidis]MDH1107330.1 phage holin family protein [Pseudomonas otitidis]MDH1158976.1 phage holin family protein [Pseudomonas otitidis]MDH1163326.1 phage holin family protein [Pseudomonas otitidis]MDI6524775.1 putative holin [Pseudomonas otitidis]